MKKIKIMGAAAAAAGLVLIFILAGVSCSRSKDLRIVKVKRGPFHITVHAVGRLQSADSLYIGCPSIPRFWSYTISFMAPEGKPVKAGDSILSFDAKQLMEQLALKKSELATEKKELEKMILVEQETWDNLVLELADARVKKEKATRKADQPKELLSMNEVKKLRMDLDLAEMQERLSQGRVENQKRKMKTLLHAQESKIKELESRVQVLQQSIAKMKVKAPKAGMLVYAVDWRGRKKAVGDRCWLGSKILELPDLKRMQVAAVIPEPQAGKVKEGLPVEIRLDSNPDRVFKGEVKSLGRIFRTKSYDQPAIVFDAVIDILDPDPDLMRPGMAAGVDIIVSSKENALQVPEGAVVYDESGLFVWKKNFMGKKMVLVALGAHSSGMVEVLEGLKENDRVIINPGANGEGQ